MDFTQESLLKEGLSKTESDEWMASFETLLKSGDSKATWKKLLHSGLLARLPLCLHGACFSKVYEGWDEKAEGPPPAWFPARTEMENSNLARALKARGLGSYAELFDWSVKKRGAYWDWAMGQVGIVWDAPYSRVLDDSKGAQHPEWLIDARLNIAQSCFSAPAENVALICVSETGERTEWTYGELKSRALQIARSLAQAGHKPGERFAIFMPMHAEAVAIYLGIVLFGGAAVSIADSFSTEEISTRLRISDAKTIFTQDGMLRSGKFLNLYDRVKASSAQKAIVLKASNSGKPAPVLRPGDVLWESFLSDSDRFEPYSAAADEVTNVLFSSGTTGDPKAIPWTHSTPIKAAVDAHFHQDVQPTDTVCWPTNLGWMMGPWLIYATFVNRAKMAIYDGGTTGRGFGEFVEKEKVSILGLVPSIVKSWKESHAMEGLNWASIKCFSSTGECSNAEEYLYLMGLARYRPIIEYCGGTEIGGAYITCTLLHPCSPATFSTPTLGLDFEILDENGKPSSQGELYLAPPSIGLSQKLINRNHDEVYFFQVPAGHRYTTLRRHGDQMEALSAGYWRALGRADDTMNLGGIKVSSAEIERVLNRVPDVLETAAVAINPPGGGPSLLVVFACLQRNAQTHEKLLKPEFQKVIRSDLNPLFKIHEVRVVERLPRTASNKVMRRVLRKQYEEGTLS